MQAVLILAHKDIEAAKRLTKILNKTFNLYVHFDTKNILSEDDILWFKNKNIEVFQNISVNWGGRTIMEYGSHSITDA